MKRKFIIYSVAIGLLIIAFSPGCGNISKKPVEIHFWYALGGSIERQLHSMIDYFNHTHPISMFSP